jgi:uncharacterized membrane protein
MDFMTVAAAAAAAAGTLALIAGGAFALTKVDEGFADFMTEASCKVRRFRVLGSRFWVWV